MGKLAHKDNLTLITVPDNEMDDTAHLEPLVLQD
jgi:hypothetical protein